MSNAPQQGRIDWRRDITEFEDLWDLDTRDVLISLRNMHLLAAKDLAGATGGMDAVICNVAVTAALAIQRAIEALEDPGGAILNPIMIRSSFPSAPAGVQLIAPGSQKRVG